MTDQDNSYRPQSPDFSTLQTSFPPSSVTPTAYPLTSPLAHRASYDASPFFTPQYQRPVAPPSRVPQQYVPPIHNQANINFDSFRFHPDNMARRSTRVARAVDVAPPEPKYVEPVLPQEEVKPTLGAGIEVKTKFPVARIKRIMQADEDVGKVAQVTPIAVSKALELFMISLVTKAAKEAKDRNSKRVTASHLKQAVVKDEVLDFLADIIAKIPDQPAGGKKHEDDGSDHTEGKRKRGGRRPKDESD